MLEIASLRLRDYTGVLRRRLWIVLVLALAAALTAYAFSVRQQPVYQASVSVLVTPSVMDHWTIQAVERMMNAFVDRVNTGDVAQRVVDQQQLDVSPDSVLGEVRMSIDPARYKITVQARSTAADQAVQVANGFAEELAQLAESEQSSGPAGDVFLRARVLDKARNALQIGPRVRFNTAIALVLGTMVGVALALAIEFLDARVRLREEAEQISGAPLLACIPPVAKSNPETGNEPT